MLVCSRCNLEHDLDKAPDEGICLSCSGFLIQDGDENIQSKSSINDEIFDLLFKMAKLSNPEKESN